MDAFILTGYTILAFVNRRSGVLATTPSFQPYAIRRESDGEIFSIGDKWFSNGGACSTGQIPHGTITGFEMLEGNIFIQHDWSGVGFSLDGIEKGVTLPSQFQVNDKVEFIIQGKNSNFGNFDAIVKGVHFYNGKVKYDLELIFAKDDVTRIYNIDSCFVEPVKNVLENK